MDEERFKQRFCSNFPFPEIPTNEELVLINLEREGEIVKSLTSELFLN